MVLKQGNLSIYWSCNGWKWVIYCSDGLLMVENRWFTLPMVWYWLKVTVSKWVFLISCTIGLEINENDWFLKDCFLFLALHIPVTYFLYCGGYVKVLAWSDECYFYGMKWTKVTTDWPVCAWGAIERGSPATDSHIPVSWGSSPSVVAIF